MTTSIVAILGVMLFVLGLATANHAVTVGGAYVAVAALLATIYAKNSLRHMRYRRRLSAGMASVGDTLTLSIEIENRKPLPVLWLCCEDEVPGSDLVSIPNTRPHYKPGRAILRNVTYLKWFERVEREFTMTCLNRGVFSLGPVKLSSGDIMGFRESSVTVDELSTLTVYPRTALVRGIAWGEHFPLGDSPSRGWINPDPLTIAGARPYAPGTPLRQVAWRATARSGEMQEKLLEPTRQSDVMVALSISTAERFWEGVNPELLDKAVFVCASLYLDLQHRNTPVGFCCNSIGAKSAQSNLVIRPGASRLHLQKVLSALAAVSTPWMEFYATVRSLPREIAADTSVLLVMARQLKDDWAAVLDLYRTGRPVTVVVLDSDERFAPLYREVPTYAPSSPVEWRTEEVIDFVRLG